VTLKAPKALPDLYPQTSNTLGDHLRKKRLDLKLHQTDVAKLPGAETATVTYWENVTRHRGRSTAATDPGEIGILFIEIIK